ncbi:LysE family translocator [Halopseudomonas pelagia]|uniref:LysE family translocator n=1 Tax=Halopseudomonas pelagia TaxID=553151 RepID=A0AA91U5F2_9GAMM|nr:LysE family transporter [Halopseudomonas pelagia]PCD01095.1 lysine transporter LysE [Halopseudomonas pelagia]QFY56449.1 LysE family translocator [Halopseudomonas pelagia]
MEFVNGFLLSMSLCLDIGVANVAMITLAMRRGYFQGFSLGVGTCVGDLIYAIMALLGMAALLQYESVRWALWVGGSIVLVYFTFKMLRSAMVENHALAISGTGQASSYFQDFSKGIFLAMSSPTAILWFAAVGGAIISSSGDKGLENAVLFLSGFFAAGVLFAGCLCYVASHGGKVLGEKLLKYSYFVSSAIFAYFAGYVILNGYFEFLK